MDILSRADLLYVDSHQLNRRNLQSIDRIALVDKQHTLTSAIKEKAKENEIIRKGNQAGSSPQKSANLKPVESRKEIAKLAGVSHDTYKKGVEILKKASPKAIEEMRAKKQSINASTKNAPECPRMRDLNITPQR